MLDELVLINFMEIKKRFFFTFRNVSDIYIRQLPEIDIRPIRAHCDF